VNDEFERILKEAVVTQFQDTIPAGIRLEGLRKTTKTVRIAGIRVEI
jgi:hypothetical protein